MESLTRRQARKEIEKAGGNWYVFIKWMFGQTGPIVKGELCYYKYDIDRFIGYKCDPKNEPPVEYD